MAAIRLPERDVEGRRNSLHAVFAPLRRPEHRLAFGRAADTPGGSIAIVAHDAKSGPLRYRDERFSTKVGALTCSYFELWRGVGGQDNLVLDRAYFTLFKTSPESRETSEVLCLHSDPGDENDLKRGPHLHLSCAPDPIPHCHFPLEFGFLEAVLKDVDALTSAMRRSIAVVAREVLPRF
jgi:hypothetical protein